MKKILVSIFSIVLGFVGFSFADGIYRNPIDGLISIVVNGQTKWTMYDKNLGATCTTLSDSCSYGNYYQWGNNYAFPTDDSISTTSTNPDLSSYGPPNYYNSQGVWSTNLSSSNWDLWGGVTNILSAMQGPCPYNSYIVPDWSDIFSDISSIGLVISNKNTLGQYLKMPVGGWRTTSATISYRGQGAHYWCSTANSNQNGNYLYVYESSLNPNDYDPRSQGGFLRCFKLTPVNPTSSRTKLYGDTIEEDPATFKVNYGNTFVEYDVQGNLSIYLKSSVTQSGNTFTYNGGTGLNLFLNSSSQFYNKDKLYISTPTSYSNNIFTPICL